MKQRFLNKVLRQPNGGCWLWMASLTTSGYGRFLIGSRTDGTRMVESAPRVSWRLFQGEIPKAGQVLHRCNNRLCVNPEHLYIGTNVDNMRDIAAAGTRKGELHLKAKLTNSIVRDIRKALENGETATVLATAYGVSTTAIHNVKSRRTWAHI